MAWKLNHQHQCIEMQQQKLIPSCNFIWKANLGFCFSLRGAVGDKSNTTIEHSSVFLSFLFFLLFFFHKFKKKGKDKDKSTEEDKNRGNEVERDREREKHGICLSLSSIYMYMYEECIYVCVQLGKGEEISR
jgi:hypothetical protein